METKPNNIVNTARQFLNTPFKHQGRSPGTALDCAGLVIAVAKAHGFSYDDYKGYGRLPHRGLLEKLLDSQTCLSKVNKNDVCAGDVLLMRFNKAPQHLGIYAGDNYMIHCYQAVKKVVEHRLDENWHGRVVAVYRFIDGV